MRIAIACNRKAGCSSYLRAEYDSDDTITAISESLVSQVERNKVSPSIDTLLSIADVLEIDLDYLFRDYKKDKKVSIVRADERDSIVLKNVTFQQLSILPDASEEHAIEAFLIEISEGGEQGDLEYGHSGKELGIIMKGMGIQADEKFNP